MAIMGHAQRELFSLPQGDLFGELDAPPAYQVKPEHVLSRLREMMSAMQSGYKWPWSPTRVRLNREIVWPYLLRLLPDEEAARWRANLDQEAERLDEEALRRQ